MLKKFNAFSLKAVEKLENNPFSWLGGTIAFFVLVLIRVAIEFILNKNFFAYGQAFFYEYSHFFFYFLILFSIMIIAINKLFNLELKKSAAVALFGAYPLALLPPIIDYFLSGGKGYWSFYEFDGLGGLWTGFLTFFGNNPQIGITYGARIMAFASIIAFGYYSFLKTGKIFRAVIHAFWLYVFLYVLGSFPSWITLLAEGWRIGFFAINDVDVARFFLTPAKFFSNEYSDNEPAHPGWFFSC